MPIEERHGVDESLRLWWKVAGDPASAGGMDLFLPLSVYLFYVGGLSQLCSVRCREAVVCALPNKRD